MTDSSQEQIEQLAKLAKIAISPQEAAELAGDLSKILSYLELLKSADISRVPEYLSDAQPGSGTRSDDPAADFDVASILAQVPVVRGSYIEVPKIKGEEG